MPDIKAQIIRDKDDRPVAVQISYTDWIALQEQLDQTSVRTHPETDINRFSGTLELHEDPLEYQRRIRSEWE